MSVRRFPAKICFQNISRNQSCLIKPLILRQKNIPNEFYHSFNFTEIMECVSLLTTISLRACNLVSWENSLIFHDNGAFEQ